jgi:hypothetical protein
VLVYEHCDAVLPSGWCDAGHPHELHHEVERRFAICVKSLDDSVHNAIWPWAFVV